MKPILAMWSGPRNLSTAMLRAWENRPDTLVWDEPLYAAYLKQTGLEHPMREVIIQHHEADIDKVIVQCITPVPQAFFYQKHMTHHMLPHYPMEWLKELHHCFLLRDPFEVLLSYSKKREQVTLEDIGLPQQLALYQWISQHHIHAPLVIDAKNFLQKPRDYLQFLCEYCGIAFDEAMLNWPAGRRDSDGIWSEHWYDSVWKSTGFSQWQSRTGELNPELQALYTQAEPLYQQLKNQELLL